MKGRGSQRFGVVALWLGVALLNACGGGTKPDALSISGVVTVPPGGDISGTVVVACYKGICEDERSVSVTVNVPGASAPYALSDLEPEPYGLAALKDVNGNGQFDAGDYGALLENYVTPPATGVNLTMSANGGGGEGAVISGTVTAPTLESVEGTLVVACSVNEAQELICGAQSPSVRLTGGSSARFTLAGLAAGTSYGILAWKDKNGDGAIDEAGDLVGISEVVTAPAEGVSVILQGGDGGPEPETGALFPDLDGGTNGDMPSLMIDATGRRHLIYSAFTEGAEGGGYPVRYGVCDADCSGLANWSFVSVGDLGFWGGYGWLALDGVKPRILYFNAETLDDDGRFVYASCDADCSSLASWRLEPLDGLPDPVGYLLDNSPYFALAPDGTPAFVYVAYPDYASYYAYRDGGTWRATRLGDDAFDAASLAFTAGGLPRLAFTHDLGDEVRVAYLSCADTACQDSDLAELPLDLEGGSAGLVLRLTAADAPRLGAFLNYPQQLAYAWCEASCAEAASWRAYATPTAEGEGDDGFDLILDAAGRPHLAYGDPYGIDLFYGFCSADCEAASATWRLGLLVESSDEVTPEPPALDCGPGSRSTSFWYPGNAPVLALNASGAPEFAYRTDNLQGCDGVYVQDGPSLIRYRAGLSAQTESHRDGARLLEENR